MSDNPTILQKKIKIIKVYSICLVCIAAGFIGFFIWFYANTKYACNLYHYNVQFVPGDPVAEDNIIGESLKSTLEMFEEHPDWEFSIEISGYGLEVMADRHPEVLKLFKKLNVDTEQLELVLSPYSDQLSVAYPSADIEKAIDLSFEIAASLDLRPSKVVFLQESQWLEDAYMLEQYYDYFVVRDEALNYYNPQIAGNHIYEYSGQNGKNIKVIPASYFPNIDLFETFIFTYLGDGEASNTESYENHFQVEEGAQEEYENTLKELERNNFQLISVKNAAEKIEEKYGLRNLNTFQSVPDATWSMESTLGPYRWMGDNSHPKTMPEEFYEEIIETTENDGKLLAKNYRLRNYIQLVETVYKNKKDLLTEQNKSDYQNFMDDAWKSLILAEVSDSTGWSPYFIEINYTLSMADKGMGYANKALSIIKEELNDVAYQVSVYHGEVNSTNFEVITKENMEFEDILIKPEVLWGYDYDITGKKCSWYDLEFEEITIKWDISNLYDFYIYFRGIGDKLGYTSALQEEDVRYLERSNLAKDVIFPGATGFFYSDALDIAIIKNCSTRHTACFFDGQDLYWKEEGFNKAFIQDWDTEDIYYQFYLFEGSDEEALKLANRINSHPINEI
mgnify:CR=1 FL=1